MLVVAPSDSQPQTYLAVTILLANQWQGTNNGEASFNNETSHVPMSNCLGNLREDHDFRK